MNAHLYHRKEMGRNTNVHGRGDISRSIRLGPGRSPTQGGRLCTLTIRGRLDKLNETVVHMRTRSVPFMSTGHPLIYVCKTTLRAISPSPSKFGHIRTARRSAPPDPLQALSGPNTVSVNLSSPWSVRNCKWEPKRHYGYTT